MSDCYDNMLSQPIAVSIKCTMKSSELNWASNPKDGVLSLYFCYMHAFCLWVQAYAASILELKQEGLISLPDWLLGTTLMNWL